MGATREPSKEPRKKNDNPDPAKYNNDISTIREELIRRAKKDEERFKKLENDQLGGKYQTILPDIHKQFESIPGYHGEPIDIPKPVKLIPDRDPAQDFYNALRLYIQQMQANLKQNEQLIVCHYNERGDETVIWKMVQKTPDLLALFADDRIILTHVNSLQITVRTLKLEKPEDKRPIRFSPLEP